ncbi:hypothetical protein SNE40_018931 [Patella caerulea]|uniref:Uncharacterized protein n=1 Tax=Patella caerulea TaxID=87958 RepID=A0AAN8J5S5_PATCE
MLYNDNNREKKTMLQMRDATVKHLIGEDNLEKLQRLAGPEEIQDAPGHQRDARPLHYLDYIPPTEKKHTQLSLVESVPQRKYARRHDSTVLNVMSSPPFVLVNVSKTIMKIGRI